MTSYRQLTRHIQDDRRDHGTAAYNYNDTYRPLAARVRSAQLHNSRRFADQLRDRTHDHAGQISTWGHRHDFIVLAPFPRSIRPTANPRQITH